MNPSTVDIALFTPPQFMNLLPDDQEVDHQHRCIWKILYRDISDLVTSMFVTEHMLPNMAAIAILIPTQNAAFQVPFIYQFICDKAIPPSKIKIIHDVTVSIDDSIPLFNRLCMPLNETLYKYKKLHTIFHANILGQIWTNQGFFKLNKLLSSHSMKVKLLFSLMILYLLMTYHLMLPIPWFIECLGNKLYSIKFIGIVYRVCEIIQ